MTRFVPAEPIPPGEFIQDEMNAMGWTQEDLATVLGMSRRQVANLLSGASGITPETAHLLAQAFEQDAATWMNLQVAYELAAAAQTNREVAKRAAVYARYPVKEMARRGWIVDHGDAGELEAEMCRFLRVANIEEAPSLPMAARKGTSYAAPGGAELAWRCRVRELSEAAPITGRYNPAKFNETIARLRQLAINRADVRRVPAILSEAGIRFVLVKHLSKTRLDGATLWLDDDSPVIAMTLRYDRIDNFWHTLMHEMDHVDHREGSLDSDIFSADESTLPEPERRANAAAANYLIPKEKLDSFIVRNQRLYYKHRIEAFARLHNVHPGIVVGQLQSRKELTWQQLRALLENFRQEIIGYALTDGWGNSPQINGGDE